MKTKHCPTCNTHKPITDFGKHKREADGLRRVCKPCNTASAKCWALANPERVKQTRAAHYIINRDRYRELGKAWAAANREKSRAIKARWSKANPEQVRDINAVYREANKPNRAAHDAMLRVRAYGCEYAEPGTQEWADVAAVYAEAQRLTEEHKTLYHVDHIIPIAEGGTHFAHNLQILTAYEHRVKSSEEQRRAAKRRWERQRAA